MFQTNGLFAATCLIILCVGGPTTALADQPQQLPIDENYFDQCTGEFIAIKGTEIISTSQRVDNNILHVQFHDNVKADGVGATTGIRYQLSQNENNEANVKLVNGAGEFDQVIRGRVIATGNNNLPDTIRKETVHLTVNANGTTTVSRKDVILECK